MTNMLEVRVERGESLLAVNISEGVSLNETIQVRMACLVSALHWSEVKSARLDFDGTCLTFLIDSVRLEDTWIEIKVALGEGTTPLSVAAPPAPSDPAYSAFRSMAGPWIECLGRSAAGTALNLTITPTSEITSGSSSVLLLSIGSKSAHSRLSMPCIELYEVIRLHAGVTVPLGEFKNVLQVTDAVDGLMTV